MNVRNGKIGIAISGGGHRATLFALGALLFLVDSGRNKDVTTVSSVSGGSLTNAFLALLPRYCDGKSFREIDDSRIFDQAAAVFAKQIAGDPRWWWASVFSYSLVLAIWLLTTIYGFPNSISLEWQLPYTIAIGGWAIFIGPRSGGTLWAAWTTWCYVGFTFFFLALGIAMCCHPPTKIAGIILFAAALLSFGARGAISQLAMGKIFASPTIRRKIRAAVMVKQDSVKSEKEATSSPPSPPLTSNDKNTHSKTAPTPEDDYLLRSISKSTRHVFCATDLHTGRHVYFSHDLVFSPDSGLGVPGTISLQKVIQSSANFPVAFPPVRFRMPKFDFVLHAPNSEPYRSNLMLSDGGIRDNMGVSWFLEAVSREKTLQERFNEAIIEKYYGSDTVGRIHAQLKAVRDIPEELLVINSSAPVFLKDPGNMNFPIWGDIRSLFKLPSIMYNNEGARQTIELRHNFLAADKEQEMRGAIISIEEEPRFLAEYLSEELIEQVTDTKVSRQHEKVRARMHSKEQQEAFLNLRDVNTKADNWLKSFLYFEYPDRNQVASSIRKSATRVKAWIKYGLSEEKLENLRTAAIELRERLKIVRDRIQKEKDILGVDRESIYLLELIQEQMETESLLEDSERDLYLYETKSSKEQSYQRLAYLAQKFEQPHKGNRNVPTTFRPLGRQITARLLWHGYYSMMVNAGVLLDYPLMPVPIMSDFERLAEGESRFH